MRLAEDARLPTKGPLRRSSLNELKFAGRRPGEATREVRQEGRGREPPAGDRAGTAEPEGARGPRRCRSRPARTGAPGAPGPARPGGRCGAGHSARGSRPEQGRAKLGRAAPAPSPAAGGRHGPGSGPESGAGSDAQGSPSPPPGEARFKMVLQARLARLRSVQGFQEQCLGWFPYILWLLIAS